MLPSQGDSRDASHTLGAPKLDLHPKTWIFFQAFPPFPLSWLGFPALFHLQGVFPREGRGGTKACSSKPTPTEPEAPPKPRELGEFLGLGLVPASYSPRGEDLNQIYSNTEVEKPQTCSGTWCWQQNPSGVFGAGKGRKRGKT